MEFPRIKNFDLRYNANNDKLNKLNHSIIPPNKKQKLSINNSNDDKKTNSVLKLKPKYINNDYDNIIPLNHESNVYRNLNDFIFDTVENKKENHIKYHSLESNVKDCLRIYDRGSDLYQSIQRGLRICISSFKTAIHQTENDTGSFTKSIVEFHSSIEVKVNILRYVFGDLDRNYILKNGLDSIMICGQSLFKSIILDDLNIKDTLFTDILNMFKVIRENVFENAKFIENLRKLNETSLKLDWETDQLQKLYIDNIKELISSNSKQMISLDVKNVIEKIEQHSKFELELNDKINYLNKSIINKILSKTYIDNLLNDVIKPGINELIYFSFNPSSIENKNVIDYESIPSICLTQVNELESLRQLCDLGGYRKELLKLSSDRVYSIIKEFVSNPENDSNLVIALIGTQREIKNIFSVALKSSPSYFRDAFSKGLRSRANKPAEMIAKFLDSLLKDKKVQGLNLEKLLDGAINMFRIVKDKDMFSAFYTLGLARRLVKDKSASSDTERSIITRITKVAGPDFTQNWEEMMKDIDISNELSNNFKYKNQTKLQKANIVQAARWPFKGQHLSLKMKDIADKDASEIAREASKTQSEMKIPQWMTEELIQFTNYYESIHANRCLTWNYSLGEVTISSEFENSKGEKDTKEIIMPLPASLILMTFNDKDDNHRMSYYQIKAETGLPDLELKRNLTSLAIGKIRLLQRFKKKDSNVGKEIDESDTFGLVTKLDHSRKRFRLPIVTAEVGVEESKETTAEVESARQFALQASAVRILKAKKRINLNELIHEVISDVGKRLTLENENGLTRQIKQTIESLIEKDYAERVEGQRNLLQYVA